MVMLQQAGLRPPPRVGSWPLLELGCGGGKQPGLPMSPTSLPSLVATRFRLPGFCPDAPRPPPPRSGLCSPRSPTSAPSWPSL